MTKFIEKFRMDCIDILSKMKQMGDSNAYEFPDDKLEETANDWLDFNIDIANNYSHRFIAERLVSFLINLKNNTKKNKVPLIDKFFKDFKNELQNTSFTFLIPQFIENLKIDSNISIGAVKFISYTEENYKEIFNKAGCKDHLFALDKTILKKVYCIGESEITAGDSYKALEKSDKIIDQSLNVIRLFDSYPNYGILGKYDRPRLHNVYYYKKEKNQFGHSGGWKKLTRPGRFTSEMNKVAKKEYGLDNINTILQKDPKKRTDMENKLMLSINWYGEILKNKESIENLIRLFTAFETLLIFEKNEEKKKNVAERLAMINYADRAMRISTYKSVIKLYSERSKLVHEGISTFKETNFYNLLKELHSCIITISTNIDKYSTIESWNNLITSVKFDGKLEF